MKKENIDYQYLIIGGAPKSATTSVFRYLSDHPQVCPANRKETYFFAREFDFKGVCQCDETLEAYETYYSHSNGTEKWRIEATPYTLYANKGAQTIASLLPDASVMFILRDPIERLLSDYRFHRQRKHPSVQCTFAKFVNKQMELSETTTTPRLIELGCYMKYLRSFYNEFEFNKIFILFYEDFKVNSKDEIQKLSVALDIDDYFYTNYQIFPHNKTINVRYDWLNHAIIHLEPVVASLRAQIMKKPKLHKIFENFVLITKSTLNILNDRGSQKKEIIPKEVIEKLNDYYQPFNHSLSKELGQHLPWKSFYQNP